MKIKKVLGLMMALAMVGMVAAPSIPSEAAGLTQAVNASTVTYGKLNKAQRNILWQLFDANYYLQQNTDLAGLFTASDVDALFNHFCALGVFEGRTCTPDFDPAAYASAYDDLSQAFGNDIIKYYQHYVAIGKNDPNRSITTVAACAEKGITVNSLAAPEIKITPAAFKIASIMGTNDFAAVQKAVDRAVAQAYSNSSSSSSSSSNDSSSEENNSGSSDIITEDNTNYTIVATLNKGGGIDIKVYKGKTGGYAAYDAETVGYSAVANPTPLAKTDDYVAALNEDGTINEQYDTGVYIPVYVFPTEYIESSLLPSSASTDNLYVHTGGDSGAAELVNSDTNGEEVSWTYVDGDYSEECRGVIDLGSDNETKYSVGFDFGTCTDSSVEFTVSVKSNEGFELADIYSVDTSGVPNTDVDPEIGHDSSEFDGDFTEEPEP